MEELLRKVRKELDAIGDKGLTSSNLETTYKLIDIYKDIKEACYYEDQIGKSLDRDDRYRGDTYRDGRRSDRDYEIRSYYPSDSKHDRYLNKMREGMHDYDEGKMRYRDGESKDRMIDGIEMTMSALVNFVEDLMDFAETSSEKEIVKKYVNKLKSL